MTRKDFLAASVVAAGMRLSADASRTADVAKPPPRNRHPYKGIDWATAYQIRGTTHVHCKTYWDWVLATGRQCFGFCVPDHSIHRKDGSFGVSVLVTPERSVYACLKAYREGNFYGAKRGLNELKFTRIAFDGKTAMAETDKPADLKVITGVGVVKEERASTKISWTMEDPFFWSGSREEAHVFARIKATAIDGSGEELFSQPYMLFPKAMT